MARHLKSNCRSNNPLLRLLSVVAMATLLVACTGMDGRPILERWPQDERGAVTSCLQSLREYLAMSPEQRAAQREQLRKSADRGDRAEKLEYAFVLSTEVDNDAALEQAQQYFENLLAAPSPLPVALDGLVRLQLSNVMNRRDALSKIDNLRETARSCGRDHTQCRDTVMTLSEELETQHEELVSLKRKLEALTRIEQTVNDEQTELIDDTDRENENATTASDSSG